MANKKVSKVLAISMLSLLSLVACSSNDVVAKPSDYDEQILKTDSDIYNNSMSIIYDAIRDGSLASSVLDKVLYQYAIGAFGLYNKVVENYSKESETTLKEAVKDAKDHQDQTTGDVSGATTANDFIKAHKAYWSTNSNGDRVADDGETVIDEKADAGQKEYARLISKWKTIEDRIAEKMHSRISSSTYAYRSRFYEERFLTALRNEGKKVAPKTATVYDPQVLDPTVKEEKVFEHFLHRENYQTNWDLNDPEAATDAATFIEDEIIPDIYRTLLTEQYIFDETYNTLGRSYARKVNIIAVKENSSYGKMASYLMDAFTKQLISAQPTGTNEVTEDTFNAVSNVIKGVDLDAASGAEQLLRDFLVDNTAIFEETSDDGIKYYRGTDFGDMMEKYAKIDDNPLLTDTGIESEFTGSNAYPVEIGRQIKENEILLKDYVTSGWYVRNGGLTELPDSIRDRLFSPGVASAVDKKEVEPTTDSVGSGDRWYQEGGEWKYSSDRDVNQYVAKINGKYYLKKDIKEVPGATNPSDGASDILFNDSSSNTYYVVQIEEAASSIKFSRTDTENNYAGLRGDDTLMEDYINEVAKVLCSGSTYTTVATKHWLSEMSIKYHDTTVYDYFKTNYPELFE